MGVQGFCSASISRTFGRIHWTLFCSPVLQMWSRRAARIERPHSLSPRVMEATATSKAASFSRTVPKSGMMFTASPVMRNYYVSVLGYLSQPPCGR